MLKSYIDKVINYYDNKQQIDFDKWQSGNDIFFKFNDGANLRYNLESNEFLLISGPTKDISIKDIISNIRQNFENIIVYPNKNIIHDITQFDKKLPLYDTINKMVKDCSGDTAVFYLEDIELTPTTEYSCTTRNMIFGIVVDMDIENNIESFEFECNGTIVFKLNTFKDIKMNLPFYSDKQNIELNNILDKYIAKDLFKIINEYANEIQIYSFCPGIFCNVSPYGQCRLLFNFKNPVGNISIKLVTGYLMNEHEFTKSFAKYIVLKYPFGKLLYAGGIISNDTDIERYDFNLNPMVINKAEY